MPAPFPIDPRLTGMVQAIRNGAMIADQVLPRKQVPKEEYKYLEFDFSQVTTLPNTRIGRRGQANEIEFGVTEKTGSVIDYGLEDPIPQKDITNAANTGYDPKAQAAEGLTSVIDLGREKRTADVVFNANTYGSNNKRTLTSTARWTDKDDSTPIDDIENAKAGMLMDPNVMVLGRATSTALRKHPDIIKAYNGTLGDTGLVPLQFLAELFDLERVLVGQSWLNSAKRGQTATHARLWGPHCALLRIEATAQPNGRIATFGWTAEIHYPGYGPRIAMERFDPNIGLLGGTRIRVGESVEEKVVGAELGYLFVNAGDAS